MFNNFLLDGMDNNAYGESNQGFDNQIIAIAPDSVADFNVVTNNESAEYGRSSGATVNVASRSGTNTFHGTFYEFLRNTDLNAAGFFKPTLVGTAGTSVPFQKPAFNRNQFGMNFGGPIVKDKLFFFLDYEGFRQTLKPLYVYTLPTQNEINGILVVPVKNPLTGATYPAGTAIPASAINPLSAQIISYYKPFLEHVARLRRRTTGLNSNDYAKEVPFTDNSDKGDLRLDYQQIGHSSWFLRISDRKETASTIRSFRCRSTARPTARSASSISRLRSATRTSSAPTRCSTRASASPAPRPASTRSPSAKTPSRSPACKLCRPESQAVCPRCPSATSRPSDARAPTRSGRTPLCSIPR